MSLMAHWYFDQDTCFLTLLESMLLGKPMDSSLMHQLVSPVYKIKDKDVKSFVWLVTPLLAVISAQRLWLQRDVVKRELSRILEKIRFESRM